MHAANLVFRFATQHVRDCFKSPVRVVREAAAAALAGLVATKLVEQEEGVEVCQLRPPDGPEHPLAPALRLADAPHDLEDSLRRHRPPRG